MTDVRIPTEHRIGERGDGWRVALTTLMNERVAIGARATPRNGGAIGELMRSLEPDRRIRRRARPHVGPLGAGRVSATDQHSR